MLARRLVQGWSWLAVILPAFLGVTLLLNPAAMPSTQESLITMMAFRNLAFSIVLLVALLTQSGQVVGFLLLARGATDVGDPMANLIASKQVTAAVVVPLVGAVLTFACAYYWLKTAGKGKSQEASGA